MAVLTAEDGVNRLALWLTTKATHQALENLGGVKFFGLMAGSEEELKAYGKSLCKGQDSCPIGCLRSGQYPLFEDAPYTDERFAEHIKELALDMLSQPHIRAVTPKQIKPDGLIDSTEEFTAATTLLERKVTLFTVTKEEKEKMRAEEKGLNGTSIPISFKIEPYEFICKKNLEKSARMISTSLGSL